MTLPLPPPPFFPGEIQQTVYNLMVEKKQSVVFFLSSIQCSVLLYFVLRMCWSISLISWLAMYMYILLVELYTDNLLTTPFSRKNPAKKTPSSSSKKLKSGATSGQSKGEATVVFKSYDKSSGVSLRSSKV